MKPIRICLIVVVLITSFMVGCNEEEANPIIPTWKPVIVLDGNILDSIYLYSPCSDPGATIEEIPGHIDWTNRFSATSGTVNTRIPGTYYLTYTAEDASGKTLSPVTRTVHVVENPIGFLNGTYDVVCTCTAVSSGSSPTISTTNYSATVFPENGRNYFRLVPVLIGGEYVGPSTYLCGDSIDGGYFSPDYHNTSLSGSISASRNSFTLRSIAYRYSPAIKYMCNSVYTKQLILTDEKNN